MKALIPIASAILGTTAVGVYLFRQNLKSRITTNAQHGHLPRSVSTNITTAPEEVFTEQTVAVYDSASISVPRRQLPALPMEELLTRFLRRNMSRFASLPQAYILRTMSTASEKPSFVPANIQRLDFKEGDVVCGAYRVLLRAPGKVEFEIKAMGAVQARLAITLAEKDDQMVFMNETLMWKPKGEKVVMPLETGVGKWLHEVTAWWMVDSGVKYLMDLKN
ncbi:uncharacterized protein CDV56_101630 [Aspergillus thermomutatus]|uniref:Uncharacterized protein n=1 Tax=Aspergillus thermomutatus TaxID=41047 RepID=A0A397G5F2_ASPTH|nr:uncharacterized protein CDV56_101630 [Aspergillus thermomutatus]RHZ46215.1 hypothetical protein CDV56_101630 [Aspergillus thermomutatus]